MKDEVVQVGVQLDSKTDTQWGVTYIARQLPKALADQDNAIMSFGFDDHLIRIAAIGKSFENDHYGGRVRERYNELKDILAKKYGPGKESSHVAEFYGDDRFAFGLQSNKNWLFTDFKTKDVDVQLGAAASGGSDTYWKIIFEYLPGMDQLGKQRKKHEEDAL